MAHAGTDEEPSLRHEAIKPFTQLDATKCKGLLKESSNNTGGEGGGGKLGGKGKGSKGGGKRGGVAYDFVQSSPPFRDEVQQMAKRAQRVELEALHIKNHPKHMSEFLGGLITDKDWIE